MDASEGHERAAKPAARLAVHQQPAVSQFPDDGGAGQPSPQAISAGMPSLAALIGSVDAVDCNTNFECDDDTAHLMLGRVQDLVWSG